MKTFEKRERYPFSPEYIDIDGEHPMAYLDEGPKDAPAVLMLHGNPSWSYLYRNVVLALKNDFRCIVPDHLGCGNSAKPQDYSYRLADHIKNIESLSEHLNIKSYSLITHDWGGAIGGGFAIRHPHMVRSFTAMNTATFLSKRIPLRIDVCKIPWLGEMLIRHFNAFAAPATWMAVVNKMDRAVANDFTYPYHSYKSRIATHRFVADIPLNTSHPSYKTMEQIDHDFGKLTMPIQIIWGGQDFCFNDSFYDTWVKRFPNAEAHYFADAGHYLLEDKGDEIYPLISTFLQNNC